MKVKIGDFNLDIYHSSAMGCLTDMWHHLNVIRMQHGRKPSSLANFLASDRTREFIEATASLLDTTPEEIVQVRGKGKARRTFAHINMLIYAAEHAHPEFHAKVIDTFVKQRILEWRDESCDEYKLMNVAVDRYLLTPMQLHKDSKRKVYIRLAQIIKRLLLVSTTPTPTPTPTPAPTPSWNTAPADVLRKRTKVEQDLVMLLEMGMVKTLSELYAAADKLIDRV